MFPNSNNAPSLSSQGGICPAISNQIPINLSLPVGPVASRYPQVTPTPMPETSIDEDYNSLTPKSKIWATGQLGMPPPTFDSVCSQYRDKF